MIEQFAEQALAQFPVQPIRIVIRRDQHGGTATVASMFVRHDNEQWAISRAVLKIRQLQATGYLRELSRFMAQKLAHRVYAR